MCTLAFELFIMSGSSELKANNFDDRRWLASSSRNSFLRAARHQGCCVWTHSSSSFAGLHTSWLWKCSSMIHRVRTQSIRTIGCRLLCVILRGLLRTSSCVGCCQLVSLFANAPGVFVLFQAPEFHHVWSNESIAQAPLRCCRPHLHYLVLIVLLLPLLRGFSPVYITEHIPKYSSIQKS